MRRAAVATFVLALVGAGASIRWGHGRPFWQPHLVAIAGGQTHAEVVARLGGTRRPALRDAAAAVESPYPPERLCLIGLKQEKVLEVWVPVATRWERLRAYPILAASGGPGPKLREGDGQVPEGAYRLSGFNPNSSYHLSIRVDYPSHDDRMAAEAEGRRRLGGDIYIHGKAVSIGCLALGDPAIEELYVLLADTGLGRARLVLSPSAEPKTPTGAPAWWSQRYDGIRRELLAVRGTSSRAASRRPRA